MGIMASPKTDIVISSLVQHQEWMTILNDDFILEEVLILCVKRPGLIPLPL
jgi:hypothetical protein